MRKVVVVGVGALGSHFIQFMRNVDCKLVAIDYDRVEKKNVLSQFHSKASVGKNKTQGLQQTLSFLYGVRVDAVPHKLTGDNSRQLLSGSSLVVDCLDNAPSRQVVRDLVRKESLPCLHGALAPGGDYGSVIWDDKFRIDGAGEGQATCEDGEHLPFIVLVASMLARVAQDFLKDGRQDSYQLFSRSPAIRI